MRKGAPGRERWDVAVVGAGVFGLCCAWHCAASGLRVIVLERDRPGAGASGGLVGALAPHQPHRWSDKKQFQIEALAGAGRFWAEVAAAGGGAPGHARIGRLVPLESEAKRQLAEAQGRGALAHWPGGGGWRLLGARDLPPWLDPGLAPHGGVLDAVSARIHPRRAVAALVAALEARGVELRRAAPVLAVEPVRLHLAGGEVEADAIVLAAGTGGPELVAPMLRGREGRLVKGQAALLAARLGPQAPLLQADGLFVVPHDDGTVAVGSTSEDTWGEPQTTDGRLEALLARAREAVPPLAAAPVVARWAALRPRAPGPDPLLGPVPGAPGIVLANGGFKIGLGIAHAVGRVAADLVLGRDPHYPARFRPEGHGLAPVNEM
jgi:glycine oxidase